MSSPYPPSVATRPAPPLTRREKLNRFWLRISEGLELNQLWSQFEKDARTSYRLYSKDFQGPQERSVLGGAPCTSHNNSSGRCSRSSRRPGAFCFWLHSS